MKERLDKLVLAAGLADTREKARTMIMEGLILVNGQREDKPGSMFKEDALVTAKEGGLKYVSRGGLKLEKAVNEFGLDLTGLTCMDVGASTGGFTDCMLQNGAKKVYSVDVGYGQFAWKLRQDERVVCLEKTNIRYADKTVIPEEIDFTSIDVSFISLTLVLIPVKALLAEKASLVCLIKPQFEAGREKVGKKGVVRDPAVHEEVIVKVLEHANELGFFIGGLTFSPVKGPEGNIEYLLYISNQPGEELQADASAVVAAAHEAMNHGGQK